MHIPDATDLDENDIVSLAVGQGDQVAIRLRTTRDKIASLIAQDGSLREVVLAAQAEFRALLEARVALMSVEALETLVEVMRGAGDDKSSNARVRAAESILDRGMLPKQTRLEKTDHRIQRTQVLPDLRDLLKRAETDKKAHELVDQYMSVVRAIDAMQRGAKEIIDANVERGNQEITPETGHCNEAANPGDIHD